MRMSPHPSETIFRITPLLIQTLETITLIQYLSVVLSIVYKRLHFDLLVYTAQSVENSCQKSNLHLSTALKPSA